MLCRAVPLVPCWHRQCSCGVFLDAFYVYSVPFFFEFSHLLGLFNNFFGLVFRELLIISKNFKHGDNSSHFYLFRGF